MALLEVEDIHAGYGKMEILRGVSLRVEAGQVVSIIGPNGAGKSTVFKTLFGLLPARQGRVRFAGEDVTNRPPGRPPASRHDLRAPGPERLPPDDGRREPPARRLHPAALGRAGARGRAGLRDVSDAPGGAAKARRGAVGRPAADAGDGAGAAPAAPADAPRRADARARAARLPRDLPDHRGPQARRADHPHGRAERRQGARDLGLRLRAGARDRTASTAPARRSGTTRAIRRLYLGR